MHCLYLERYINVGRAKTQPYRNIPTLGAGGTFSQDSFMPFRLNWPHFPRLVFLTRVYLYSCVVCNLRHPKDGVLQIHSRPCPSCFWRRVVTNGWPSAFEPYTKAPCKDTSQSLINDSQFSCISTHCVMYLDSGRLMSKLKNTR